MNQPSLDAGLARAPIANVQQTVAWIDSVVFALILFVIAMPFGYISIHPVGINKLNVYTIVYFLVTCLLLMKIIYLGKIRFAGLAASFLFTVAVYVAASVTFGDANIVDALKQVHYYWPFAIAMLLLTAGTNADVRKFFRYTGVAMLISSSSALIMYYFFPSYVKSLYEGAPESPLTIEAGRMRWDSDPATLFIILYFIVQDKHSRMSRILAGAALIVSVSASFDTQTRTILAGILALLIGSIFIARARREAVSRAVRVLGISLLFAAVIGALLMADSHARTLAYTRFMGGGGGAQMIYQGDLVLARMSMYHQYWNSITGHFPWGQGFGLPYSTLLMQPVVVSDISLLAFLLPLGVLGVVLFGLFIRALWRTATLSSAKLPPKYRRAVKLLIVVSLLVSLNTDIFSRNNYVVMLTLLILCMGNSNAQIPAGEFNIQQAINVQGSA